MYSQYQLTIEGVAYLNAQVSKLREDLGVVVDRTVSIYVATEPQSWTRIISNMMPNLGREAFRVYDKLTTMDYPPVDINVGNNSIMLNPNSLATRELRLAERILEVLQRYEIVVGIGNPSLIDRYSAVAEDERARRICRVILADMKLQISAEDRSLAMRTIDDYLDRLPDELKDKVKNAIQDAKITEVYPSSVF